MKLAKASWWSSYAQLFHCRLHHRTNGSALQACSFRGDSWPFPAWGCFCLISMLILNHLLLCSLEIFLLNLKRNCLRCRISFSPLTLDVAGSMKHVIEESQCIDQLMGFWLSSLFPSQLFRNWRRWQFSGYLRVIQFHLTLEFACINPSLGSCAALSSYLSR